MYLSCVKIKNFRGYGENLDREDRCYVYDDLEAPLVIFKGYNGFGKTSFYEAIEWCLTDNVYRLEKFYEDNTYRVNELKRSHYLKFYHPIHGNSTKREIYVELIFSNGLRIIRKSNSNILRTTDKDRLYKSTVLMGYDKLNEVTNEQILKQFILKAKNIDVFFHTHMLGQESISDFLRHNSPAKRREIFMQLLQEEELNALFLEVQKYINAGNSISKKKSDLDKKIGEYQTSQREIEKFIRNLDFGNLEEYLNSLQDYYKLIEKIINDNIELSKKLEVDSLILHNKINIENCVSFLQNVSFSQTKLAAHKESNLAKREELGRIKNKLETLKVLNTAKIKIQNSEHAKKLLENNIDELQAKLEELKGGKKHSSDSKKKFEKTLNKLIAYKNTFSNLTFYIKMTDLKIKEDLWKEFEKELSRWVSFNTEFKDLLNDNEIKNTNTEWFNLIRKNYDEYQVKINQKKSSLEEIRKTKSVVSELNTEYQQVLSQVKKLLIENADINNCPVCLNDDFSDAKYNVKVNNWEPDSSISEKILAIVDTTSSSGSKEIEELSTKESEIIEDIKSLQSSLKKEVLEQLANKLVNIKDEFVSIFEMIEEQINNKINEFDAELQKHKKEIEVESNKYNKLIESINALFGIDQTLNVIEKGKLEKFIINKEEWFKLNSEKFDILKNTVSLTEIENEITLLKGGKVNQYTEVDITLNIENINAEDEIINRILEKLNEISKFKIPVEYESGLKEFDNLSNKITNLSQKKVLLDQYRQEINDVHGKLLGQQRRVVKERLEKHPIISWVYETINPHPFHKKLHITNTERGTNFIGETQLDDKIELYLDQMFSTAQLNILALSIFFGLGLTQRYSKLQQLFLDDPIQSMDDVNILALIDVIRAIMDSRYNDKHIVISTHNEDFAQLVAIKMRNRGIVQYNITGYTEEGPKVVKIK
ncbi:AAA family ATPase [Alkalihalobacterium elongatum]|uniref:AAA family ATPase n=1 Tax=Alkalihalobacterium elongatum TaxID=2675466 RepID=UPI001C1F710E|nr:AAA family ATPase [Alkalihalobacterium elongatum]